MGVRRIDDEAMMRMQQQGMSGREMADAAGVSSRSVTRWRNRKGLTSRNELAVPVTPEKLAAARALFDDGASQAEVMRTLHFSRDTLARHFPDQKWSQSQAGEYSRLLRSYRERGVAV